LLYGVGLGPGDRKLLTLRAIEIIKSSDEVIVPGKLAYDLIKHLREPRLVEFPMGESEDVARKLGKELSEKMDEEIAFCCLGDPIFYSTFHHVVEELKKCNPQAQVEIIPGITSMSCALAKTLIFVNESMLLTTQDFHEVNVAVVLKAKNLGKIKEELSKMGFNRFKLVEKMFLEGERIYDEIPEKAGYFSVLIADKGGVDVGKCVRNEK
jgi:precorrin-2/cobalt-factor-2 C20-methyltransferase